MIVSLVNTEARWEEQCKSPDMVEISLTIDRGRQGILPINKYPFQDQWKFANDTYFTVDGYIYLPGFNFLNPDDYCVES